MIGDLSGTAQVYATRKRFYAVVVLNTKKDDALSEQFLSSFYLPEKGMQPAANATIAETPAASGTSDGAKPAKREPVDDAQRAEAATASDAAAQPKPSGDAAPDPKAKRAPISGGVLNGKALYLPKPDYPSGVDASGTVVVQVTIDEQGNVINAKAVSGPPALQQVCVNAALQARFSPTSLMGEPVKVNGVITYNFVR